MIKNCDVCGESFSQTHPRVKRCSKECRRVASVKYKRQHYIANIQKYRESHERNYKKNKKRCVERAVKWNNKNKQRRYEIWKKYYESKGRKTNLTYQKKPEQIEYRRKYWAEHIDERRKIGRKYLYKNTWAESMVDTLELMYQIRKRIKEYEQK